MKVPCLELKPASEELGDELDEACRRVLSSGWYILGQEGEAFEREFAAWLGTTRAVGCANGTDALALILRGLGIGEGMTVATVSHTAVASEASISDTSALRPTLWRTTPTSPASVA